MKKFCSILFMLVAATIFLSSCDGNAIFSDKKDGFENNRWEKKDVLDFSFDVESGAEYSFAVFFSHIYGYQFAEVPVLLEIQYPDNHIETENVIIPIKDPDGNEAGDCSGDYCDLWHTVEPSRRLETGHYTVKLSHAFQGPFLPNVLSVGLKVSNPAESK